MDSTSLRDALIRLARNHRWTWKPSCEELLRSLPHAEPDRHPVVVVSELSREQLDQLAADSELTERVVAELEDLERETTEPLHPRIAYCSPEFGIAGVIPLYSGGLGVLAGDHLKAASDMGLPLVGVGLFYRHGYFTQVIDDGEQTEAYPTLTPDRVGAVDTGVVVEIPFPGREVKARVWRMEVGRIPLFLLDTDLETNDDHDRGITDRLYGGDRRHRLDQEMLLGVGGARALAALGEEIPVHHLNEGHAGFIALEMIDRVITDSDLTTALSKVSPGLVFTTHTPVPAGIDRFARDLILPYLETWAKRWGVTTDEVWSLGEDPEDEDRFNMAALTLRLASSANGVSRLHGEVSRRLFAGVGIGDSIGSITNGVHSRTWVGAELQDLFDQVLGPSWADGDTAAWDRVDAIEEERLGEARVNASRRLARLVHTATGHELDPEALTIGFARRFAPYKRATLILRDAERLAALIGDVDRPVHFVYAGKAHPLDDLGKALLADIVGYSEANPGFTFVPGYDMSIARTLVEGCDIWLNNPIRPREASGTSGEKAVLNGVLNCSILDGWWAEMYDGENGWAIAASQAEDPELRDAAEAESIYQTLEEIRDLYYGDRPGFHRRIRHAWRTLGPKVVAARMLSEYRDQVYLPALERVGAASG